MDYTSLAQAAEPDELTSNFDKSAAVVRDSLQRLENEIARPFMQYVCDSFRLHPVRSTYVTIFSCLALLPAISFVGFSLFVITSFLGVAITVALIAASTVIAFFGALFLASLVLLAGISLLLTATTLGTYLLIRLALFTYNAGPRTGIAEWANESRRQLLPLRFHPVERHSGHTPPKSEEERSRDYMAASKYSNGGIAGPLEDGLVDNGAVGADLGSPPTVEKSELANG
ncbi:hypothetical protein FOMPIDRAFT_99599 [Fomitopsis schrenkii]|uniref:Uncharacterized protein n=1 Tax=Fomitopsis schrenkii TaxID=2126942 RepID=S8FKD1_FOMSC|nr:hypothetical protein FOMPIDRAFT_99599 [Fomitopsis schrenkii]